jgi:Cys-rich protein (TIGR01571 family)
MFVARGIREIESVIHHAVTCGASNDIFFETLPFDGAVGVVSGMGFFDFFRRKAERASVEPIRQRIRKSYIDEIKDGGLEGAFGLDQVFWGPKIGSVWEVYRLSPCCGEPPNCDDGVRCCAIWYCCSLCAFAKLYSSSLGQPCSLVPHVVCAYFCPFCAMAFLRYNLRFHNEVDGNVLGDFMCVLGCCPCACLQHLRSVKIDEWKVTKIQCPSAIAPIPQVIV